MVLNFALVLLAVLGVVFAILTFTRTHELGMLKTQYNQSNAFLMRFQGLVNQVAAYNQGQKVPDRNLTGILQSIQPKGNPSK
jgi:hypothetical protein